MLALPIFLDMPLVYMAVTVSIEYFGCSNRQPRVKFQTLILSSQPETKNGRETVERIMFVRGMDSPRLL